MNIFTSFFVQIIPLKIRILIFFRFKQGYFFNFNSPKTFSEKIQLRKLQLSKADAELADKYKVRSYVEKRIGNQYLIPLVGVYDKLSLEVLNHIPENTVIKTNHGSGGSHLHFFSTRSNKPKVLEQFHKALNENYVGSLLGETHYELIDRKIIIEEELDFSGDSPPDYKFHIFRKNNEINWVLQIDFDRFKDHKRNYYDSDLNLLDLEVIYKNGNFELPQKIIIDKMANLAIKLNDKYLYSRIDLYLHNNNIFFGEITLTPGSGFEKFSSKAIDILFGDLWGEFTHLN